MKRYKQHRFINPFKHLSCMPPGANFHLFLPALCMFHKNFKAVNSIDVQIGHHYQAYIVIPLSSVRIVHWSSLLPNIWEACGETIWFQLAQFVMSQSSLGLHVNSRRNNSIGRIAVLCHFRKNVQMLVISCFRIKRSYGQKGIDLIWDEKVKQLMTGIRSFLWKWHNTVILPTE